MYDSHNAHSRHSKGKGKRNRIDQLLYWYRYDCVVMIGLCTCKAGFCEYKKHISVSPNAVDLCRLIMRWKDVGERVGYCDLQVRTMRVANVDVERERGLERAT